ncbi:MAG: DegV family protein [Lachnospiraceae bacterium]|nr:DegV family protein [Lachnospiraceae bacterium]
MEKIKVITDSNSGMTEEEALNAGIKVLPMPFLIDEKTYYENITLTQKEFYEKLQADTDISTSQPTIPDVKKCWDEELENYDSIVYIPMSSGLSGSLSTAKMLADDYDGRVQVVDNQRISVTQFQSALDAVELANEGYSAKEIKDILEEVKFDSSIYIKLETLKYLKKGGRITPAAAAIGSALKLKPVLQIQGEKLDAFTIARTGKQAEIKMLKAMEHDIETRFGGMDNIENIHIEVAHTANEEAAEYFKQEIMEKFGVKDVLVSPLSLSIACHIGPGALAIACSVDIHESIRKHGLVPANVS